MASHLRLILLLGFGGIEAVDTEFPYRVPVIDRGAIAVPLFAHPISDSWMEGACFYGGFAVDSLADFSADFLAQV